MDTLKIISKHRSAIGNISHIGLTIHNDKIRFNVYNRPDARTLENNLSWVYSPLFDLGINPGESKVNNLQDYTDFLSILNVVLSVDQDIIDQAFSDYVLELENVHKTIRFDEINQSDNKEEVKLSH